MDASDVLSGVRLLPVVVLDAAADAVPLARVLHAAGISAIEVTLRTDAAFEAIRRIAAALPSMLVGAGSIRRVAQFDAVQAAGAKFAVSPGSTAALRAAAHLPWLPGAATASECLALLEAGYRLQKFFPAEHNGGAAALRALSAPIPEVRFCPTGGLSAANVADYLALDAVSCVGGSWFVPAALVREGNFERIGELAAAAVALTRRAGWCQ